MATNSAYAFAEIFRNSFDFNQLFATQRRNIEALSAANQVVVEGVQAITRRQAELLRENVENVMQASRDILTGGSPEASLSKQAEAAKSVFQNTLENVREVTEMATKSSFEAFDVLNRRATESLEEIGATAASATRKKPSAK